ncbi:MAG: ACT domain-containing protein, partial [Pseudomonadota bacterium]
DGVDAAHKLVILASLAFDAAVSMQNTSIGGIRHITLEDVRAARRLGMSIKLLGEAKMQEERVGLRVTPALIPQADPFAKASGSQNVVTVDANPLGRLAFQGPGAGAGATAAAVAADLGLIARNIKGPTYGVAAEDLRDLPILPVEDFENSYFIRLNLQDEPGALAAVAEALAAARVSIESLYQPPGDEGQASVEIVTHICKAAAAQNAAGALEKQPFVLGRPTVLPIILP